MTGISVQRGRRCKNIYVCSLQPSHIGLWGIVISRKMFANPFSSHKKGTNRLERFTRLPSDLRRYREYIYKLKREYGSVTNFIVEKRLQWTEMEPEDTAPFGNPSTGSILLSCCFFFDFWFFDFLFLFSPLLESAAPRLSYYKILIWRKRWLQNPVQWLAVWSRHRYHSLGYLDQVSPGREPCHRWSDRRDESEGWGLHPADFVWENCKGKCMLWQYLKCVYIRRY